jgi:hypothetical protein
VRYNPRVRRLLRILINAATVVSLVLCVGAVVLWAQSYWWADRWLSESQGRRYVALAANRGTFYLTWTAIDARENGEWGLSFTMPPGFSTVAATREDDDDKSTGFSSFLGFKWLFGDVGPMSVRMYGVPAWFIVALTSTPPLIALGRIRRRRRQANRGLCPACGYDLRATPDRCPECGTMPRR